MATCVEERWGEKALHRKLQTVPSKVFNTNSSGIGICQQIAGSQLTETGFMSLGGDQVK